MTAAEGSALLTKCRFWPRYSFQARAGSRAALLSYDTPVCMQRLPKLLCSQPQRNMFGNGQTFIECEAGCRAIPSARQPGGGAPIQALPRRLHAPVGQLRELDRLTGVCLPHRKVPLCVEALPRINIPINCTPPGIDHRDDQAFPGIPAGPLTRELYECSCTSLHRAPATSHAHIARQWLGACLVPPPWALPHDGLL